VVLRFVLRMLLKLLMLGMFGRLLKGKTK